MYSMMTVRGLNLIKDQTTTGSLMNLHPQMEKRYINIITSLCGRADMHRQFRLRK